jgi:hypothetical protein
MVIPTSGSSTSSQIESYAEEYDRDDAEAGEEQWVFGDEVGQHSGDDDDESSKGELEPE